MFPKIASTQEIQRNYRKIFDDVMRDKDPVIVFVNNKPQVAIVDFHEFEKLQKKMPKKKSKTQLDFEKSEKELVKLLIALDKKGKLKKYFVKKPAGL